MSKKLILFSSVVLVLTLVSTNVLAAIVWEGRIISSTDDREHYVGGAIDAATSSDLEMPYESAGKGAPQVIGLRFVNVEVPKGANIANAYLEFVCDETKDGSLPVSLIIEGQPDPDPPTFTTDIIGRPRTTAQAVWEPADWTAAGQVDQTSDISVVIREIVNQGGWASGNALVLIISDNPGNPSQGLRCAEAFDGSAPQAALLHIEFSSKYASNPVPADGSLYEDTWVSLSWDPGETAASHDVYLSDNLDDVTNGTGDAPRGNQPSAFFVAGFPGFPYPDGLIPGTTYYWRVDEVEADGTTKYTGSVWSFSIPSKTAYNPSPRNGAIAVDPDVTLSWTAGFGSKLHTIYFGQDLDTVTNAAGGLPQGTRTYSPGTLEKDKTYYWRVDEFDGMNTYKGNVWTFKTVPEITITDPDLIGWWKFDNISGGDTVLDWSGYGNDGKLGGDPELVDGVIDFGLDLDGDDYVMIDGIVGDLTSRSFSLSIWIKTTQAGEGNVFASNTGSSHVLLFGVDNGNIYADPGGDFPPAVNDNQWHMITYVKSGSNAIFYTDGLEVGRVSTSIDVTTETRWSIGQEWDSGPSDFYLGAVDDAHFYNRALTTDEVAQLLRGDPLVAWNPKPGNGALIDVDRAKQPLSWSPGDDASQHDVYFATDKTAVDMADTSTADVYRGRQNGTTYSPPEGLPWGTGPYYWRVDEFNSDGSVSRGSVWSFTVADFLIVDDFESYNDTDPPDPESNRIFEAWIDGFGTTTNGALVGNDMPPYAARNIVHSGIQAMPYYYDNNLKTSEATLTLVSPRDWTKESVAELSLWFSGDPANAPARMFVALNGNVVVYHSNSAVTQTAGWTEWVIDLQTFAGLGVNLANVNTITLGFGTKNSPAAGGTGTMYFDDIRLYQPRTAP
ncbi:MAG: LamG domain-containing protein [Planctomycetota bacterium]